MKLGGEKGICIRLYVKLLWRSLSLPRGTLIDYQHRRKKSSDYFLRFSQLTKSNFVNLAQRRDYHRS